MGILSSNSTLDIKDSASNGVVILKPTAGDTSIATINRTQAGRTRLKALQPLRYATVDASNKLRLNNISLGKNSCFAILVRIEIPEASNATSPALLTSVQTIPSGTHIGQPRFQILVGGRLTSTPSNIARGTFCTYTSDNSGTLKLNAHDTSTIRQMYGARGAEKLTFGSTGSPRIGKEWMWFIIKRNVSLKPNLNCFDQTSITFAGSNQMSVSIGFITKRPQLSGSACITARNVLANVLGTTATDNPENENNLDFIIGGTVPFDIARIVKIDAGLEAVQISGVMMGKSADDFNLSSSWDSVTSYVTGTRVKDGGNEFIAIAPSTNEPTSNTSFWRPVEDIVVNFGTTLDPKITVESGIYVTGVDTDQLLEQDIGYVTTTLAKSISNGEVL